MTRNTASVAQATVTVGVGLLIATSAALGAYYGYTLGAHHHLILGILFATAALGGELLKPFAVLATMDAIRSLNIFRLLACATVTVVCITYSLAAELSLSAALRGDQAAQRGAIVGRMVQAKEDRQLALQELNLLGTAPTVGVLQAQIDRLNAIPGAVCNADPKSIQYGPISKRVCPKVLLLRAELSRARRKAALEARLQKATAVMDEASDKGQVVGHASPLAESLVSYATAAGYGWKVEDIAPWLALLVPLLLEVGSSFGLVVARSLGTGQPVSQGTVPLIASGSRTPGLSVGTWDNGTPPLRTALLDHLRQAGGTLQTDQRGLARLLEVSKSELNRALHTLAEDGRILLSTDRRMGTRIELASV